MQREIFFTAYRSARTSTGVVIKKTWAEWLSVFGEHAVRGVPSDENDKARLDAAKDGEAIVLGVVEGGRKNANVKEIYALGLDLETSDENTARVLELLEPYTFAAYTTHKSGAAVVGGLVRLRVIVPLEEPITPEEHADAWARLNAFTENHTDQSTKDPARLFYLPSTYNKEKALAWYNSGRWLDYKTLPEASFTPHRIVQAEEFTPPEKADVTKHVAAIQTVLNRALRSTWISHKGDAIAHIAKKVLMGSPYAEKGARHSANLALTWYLANNAPLKLCLDAFEAVLGPSIAAMRAQGDTADTQIETIYKQYGDGYEKSKAQQKQRLEERSKLKAERAERRQARLEKRRVENLEREKRKKERQKQVEERRTQKEKERAEREARRAQKLQEEAQTEEQKRAEREARRAQKLQEEAQTEEQKRAEREARRAQKLQEEAQTEEQKRAVKEEKRAEAQKALEQKRAERERLREERRAARLAAELAERAAKQKDREERKAKAVEANKELALKTQLAQTPTGPYTQEDIESFAARQGWPVEDIDKRWIIQKASNYFFLVAPGTYAGPYDQNEARAAAVMHLSRAAGRVYLSEPTPTGLRRKRIDELVEEYGTVAQEVIADATAQFTYYNHETRRIHEAVCPLRPIAPQYDEDIDAWLQLLGGEKLLDWVACVPDTSKILCALWLAGKKGGGKTLLAHGLARLWIDGAPTELSRILDNFNEELARCPLAFADEELPSRRGENITAKLRAMIGTVDRTLSRKYRAPAILHGAPRVILAANNPFMLTQKGVSTHHDLEAIGERFLHVEVKDDAAELMEIIPREVKERWRDEAIAAHALWLMRNRAVKPGKRFWVEGSVGEMHRMLLFSSDWNARICEWLVRFAQNPQPYARTVKELVRIGEGKFLVNDQAVIDTWQQMFPHTHVEPDTSKINAALRAVSAKSRPYLKFGNKRVRYREIDVDVLFAWASESGVGELAAMRRNLGLPALDGDESSIAEIEQPRNIVGRIGAAQ